MPTLNPQSKVAKDSASPTGTKKGKNPFRLNSPEK